jgi:hypothetical protein
MVSRTEYYSFRQIKNLFLESHPEKYLMLLAAGINGLHKKELKLLFSFLKKNKKYAFLLGKSKFGNLEHLSNFYTIIKNDINNDSIIYWSQLILEENSKRLVSYIATKKKYEDDFLIGNYNKCFTYLDEIERMFGFSWWLIETKIELINRSKGAVSKVSFVNSLLDTKVNDDSTLFFLILEKISRRGDEKTRLTSFKKQMNSLFSGQDIPDDIKQHINYMLFKKLPSGSDYSLLSDSIINVVDLFESFTYLATRVSNDNDPDLNQFHKSVRSIYKSVPSHVFLNLLLTIDPNLKLKNARKFSPSLAGTAFLKGDYESSKELSLINLKKYPSCFESIHILTCVHPSDKELIDAGIGVHTLVFEIITNITKYKTYKNGTDLIFSEIEKVVYNNYGLNITHIIESILNEVSNLCDTQITKINGRFFSTLKHDVFTIGMLDYVFCGTMELSEQNSKIKRLIHAKKHNDIVSIDHLTSELILENKSELNRIYIINERCKSLIDQDKYFECIQLSVDNLLLRRALLDILPVEKLISKRRWSFYSEFKDKIEIPIIISLYLRSNEDSLQTTNLGFAWNWFRKSKNVFDVSKLFLDDLKGIEKEKGIYFLSEVSTPQVLENHTEGLDSQEEVLIARADIIKKLIELDSSQAVTYEKERISLLKNISIQKGLNNLNQNKIYVDTNIIRNWATREVKLAYEQYQDSLTHPETTVQNTDTISFMLDNFLKELINPPEELILYSMISSEYLNNKQGGLNFFLSMRIRHGKFEGTLRKPLSDNHLLTTKNEQGEYLSNNYWNDKLTISESVKKLLDEKLKKLSVLFDEIIFSYLFGKLRCYSDEYPNGKIFTKPTLESRLHLKEHIINGMNFEEFLDLVIGLTKSDVERCLVGIHDSIHFDISKKILSELNQILEFSEKENLNELSDKVKSTLGQFENTCKVVTKWFHYDEIDIEKESLSINDCIEISQASIKETYSTISLEPRIIHSNDPNMKLSDLDSNYLNEALYIMFENIYKRSKLSKNIKVKIRISIDTLGRLKIVMINSISKSVYNDVNLLKVKTIKGMLDSGEYLVQANGEVNSGILKLRNLNPSKDNKCLRFRLCKSAFYIDFRLFLGSARRIGI